MGKKPSGKPSKWGKGKIDPDSYFKTGCKPGPGRPRGSKNARTIWNEINAQKVKVVKGAKTVAVTKQALKYESLANQAASGHLKAIQLAMLLDDKYAPVETAPPTSLEAAADLATLEAIIAHQQKFAKPAGDS